MHSSLQGSWLLGGAFMADTPAAGSAASPFPMNVTSSRLSDANAAGAVSFAGGNGTAVSVAGLRDGSEYMTDAYEGLAAAYAFVGLIALVQLVRIHRRVPDYGWTTQKVFHLLNVIVCAARCACFLYRNDVEQIPSEVLISIIVDFPNLVFFTTYTLLILFWAEIYHQARGIPSEDLRRSFFLINAMFYVLQGLVWLLEVFVPSEGYVLLNHLSDMVRTGVGFAGAFGFMVYGGRLFVMLSQFPVESRGRRNKLMEVGLVTAVCFTSFTIRAFVILFSAIDLDKAPLDVLDAYIFNVVYYAVVEIIPITLVLYILRKLPPRRQFNSQSLQY